MVTIFEYIKTYGKYTFKERIINEVDKMIFSFISYINLEKKYIKEFMTIEEMSKKIEEEKDNKKNIIAEKDAKKILIEISKTNRYKECKIFNYIYESDDNHQFSALTIEYLDKNIYISFEGTDEKMSSWYEDILLSYQTSTISHIKATKYLRQYTFKNYNIIVGGHSKGGNLALVSAMNSNFFLRKKIKEIYSMDGPGILPKEINTRKYKRIENKYYHIIPENSMIGILLESTKNIAIKTTKSGIIAHDIIYWDITDSHLTRSKLSNLSKTLRNNLNQFIYSLDNEQLKIITNNFSKICKNAEIISVIEITENNKLVKLLKEISKIDDTSKKLIIELIEIIIKSTNKSISLNILSKIERLKERIGK